jgi:hypothetical protein
MAIFDAIFNTGKNIKNKTASVLADALLGKPPATASAPTDVEKKEDGTILINSGVSLAPREGGLLRDIAQGYKENSRNAFNVDNLGDAITDNGRKKGISYRLGEGIGTLARIGDSPLGRGLITAGIIGASGGSGLEALAFGGSAGVMNQANRTQDSIYRKQLKDLGMSEEEVDSIRGYITGDTYKNIADTFKARWNKTSWGDLANFNPKIKEVIQANPQLANTYVPASVANTILKGDLTDAQIANLLAQAKLAGVKGEAAMINANANATKANSYKEVNDAILGSGVQGTGTVKMQSADGRIFNVPVNRVQEMITKGGKVIG